MITELGIMIWISIKRGGAKRPEKHAKEKMDRT